MKAKENKRFAGAEHGKQNVMVVLQGGTSKRKKKWAICKCGTLKIKCSDRFADAEQVKVKGNKRFTSIEH